MPRKAIIRSDSNYYHITARSNNREYFYLPIDEVWSIMLSELQCLQQEHGMKVAAFVLMNNHFHLLVLTPTIDIDRLMYFFMKRVTLKMQKKTGRINKIFGGRYKGSLIDSFTYLVNVYKYILRNPIEAKLTRNAEDYVYSTLYFQQRIDAECPILIDKLFGDMVFKETHHRCELNWINQAFKPHEAQSIKMGLKKTHFAFEKDRSTGREIIPELS